MKRFTNKKNCSTQSKISGFFQNTSPETQNKLVRENEDNGIKRCQVQKKQPSFTKISCNHASSSESLLTHESPDLSTNFTSQHQLFIVRQEAKRKHSINSLESSSRSLHLQQVSCNPDRIQTTPNKGSLRSEETTLVSLTASQEADDSLIIPDTPDQMAGKKKLNIKHKTSRSFLFSPSSLASKPGDGVKLKSQPVNKSKPLRTVEESLTDDQVPSLEEKVEGKVGLISVMSEMGLDIHQRAHMGMDYELSKVEKTGNGNGSSTRKRAHSKGSSPSPKRNPSKVPHTKDVKCLMSRGAIMVHNSNFISKKECSHTKSQTSTTISLVEKEKKDEKENVKWGLKRESFAISAKSNHVLAGTAKKKVKQDLIQCDNAEEDSLDDILSELKATLSPDGVKSRQKGICDSSVITTKGNKRDDFMFKQITPNNASLMAEDIARNALVEDGEDEALNEILSELNTKVSNLAASVCGKQNNSAKSKMAKNATRKKSPDCESDNNYIDSNSHSMREHNGHDKMTAGKSKICTPVKAKEDVFPLDSELDEIAKCLDEESPFKVQTNRYSTDNYLPAATKFSRHVVLEIKYDAKQNISVEVEEVFTKVRRTLILEGFWSDIQISVGDIVNILGEFNADNVCYITDKNNLFVIHPDWLISGTSVVNSIHCMRKSVLNETFKGCDSGNVYMLYGSIIHTIFQQILKMNAFSRHHIDGVINKTLKQPWCLQEILSQNVTEATVREEIEKYIPQIIKFVDKYVSLQHQQGCTAKNAKADVAITKIADIEENVWSPRFGIKGKIDLTVEVKIRNKDKWHKKVMPLELKTGKASFSMEHKGQVTLYSMMFGDRRVDPESGLLLYLKEGKLEIIPASHTHKRGLLQLRNELAHYLKTSTDKIEDLSSKGGWKFGNLPRPINRENMCNKCPQLLNCSLYQSTMEEWSLPSDHIMHTLVPQSLSHLKMVHLSYFSHWCRLLLMELSVTQSKSGIKSLWCETGLERELKGECLSNLKLQGKTLHVVGDQLLQIFRRQQNHPSKVHLSDVGLNKNDSVVVSAQNKPLIAITTGTIMELDAASVTLVLDRDLTSYPEYKDLVYRVDKLDYFNTMGINFTNLSKLMSDTAQSGKLRELIIERKKPEFDLTLSKSSIAKVKDIFISLNKPQKTAVLKVLMSKDYVLIKGYPGTGKTSTIVSLVRILTALGQSVLLASYTHSAVDNILLKLKQYSVDFLRLGRAQRIHLDILPHAAEVLTKDIRNVDELRNLYHSKLVVATTCLGTNHPLFSERQFDVCIIDEASQVLQPACFGPLMCSRKFVLVGDPLQLAPVVQSNEAKREGLDESLFARLDDTGATYELNLQYRMNSIIMHLCNKLVYGGALQCGNTTVSTATLAIKDQKPLHQANSWLQEAISADPGKEVIWLNTEKSCEELVKAKLCADKISSRSDSNMKNEIEAKVVLNLVTMATQCGLPQDSIGVITPYRQQVWLLRQILCEKKMDCIEVNTVDQYQGRDKELIIMSFVKYHKVESDAVNRGILSDLKRLNVAITRAKHKLILIGCIPALMTYEPVAALIKLIDAEHIIQLPAFN